MDQKLDIAVIGCGTAGMAAAAFLEKDGHRVTLFEKFSQPRPLGSGLMIQPTGLACLARLGLAEKAISLGARIDHLHGHTIDGKMIFDVSYERIGAHLFGLGIHRGALFSILFDEIKRMGTKLITSCEVAHTRIQANRRVIYNGQGEILGDYDLVVDASGVHSPLRTALARVRYNKPYPYGAVWGVCEDPDQAFGGAFLRQRYHGAGVMIGALAIGRRPDDDKKTIAFFWSLPTSLYPSWREAGLEPWRERVIECWPAMAPFVGQFRSMDDLTFTQYTDTILERWNEERLIFIGDAGHCSSPQLGQGANMALIDALTLSQTLKNYGELDEALRAYTRSRKRHVHFYQWASRWLTPFFQSDSKMAAAVRDLTFGPMCKTPYLRTEMARTLAGIKTGLITHLNPGKWHPDYDLHNSQPR